MSIIFDFVELQDKIKLEIVRINDMLFDVDVVQHITTYCGVVPDYIEYFGLEVAAASAEARLHDPSAGEYWVVPFEYFEMSDDDIIEDYIFRCKRDYENELLSEIARTEAKVKRLKEEAEKYGLRLVKE